MKQRCRNPRHAHYRNYGGRGISVCERWLSDFWVFVADVGPRPAGTSLDRINNEGNYEPANVRWATRKEQANNRRRRYDHGELHSQAKLTEREVGVIRSSFTMGASKTDLARQFGVTRTAIYAVVTGKTWREVSGERAVAK